MTLRVERIAEIRTGDAWRNIVDQLARIKVVEYEHTGVRIRWTSEIDRELTALLAKLGVPVPPKLHTDVTEIVSTADQSISNLTYRLGSRHLWVDHAYLSGTKQ